MPRVVETSRGRVWQSAKGAQLGLVGGMGSAGREYVPGEIHRSDRMAEQGLYADQQAGVMRPGGDVFVVSTGEDLDALARSVGYSDVPWLASAILSMGALFVVLGLAAVLKR